MKKILMIALDFPPCLSAGVQRTLKFCEYLPDYGWEPAVLTVPAFVHEKLDLNAGLPATLDGHVYRAFALNSVKHLSVKGKYFRFTALPDRYVTWYCHGSFVGKKIINEFKPDVIWSTFPYSTAHRIAANLKKVSGIPWVADFRDPFPIYEDPALNINRSGRHIDQVASKHADRLIFTTSKSVDLYRKRYPYLDDNKVQVIENGYNEDVFNSLGAVDSEVAGEKDVLRIVYSGGIYRDGRNPDKLFSALNRYNQQASSKKTISLDFWGVENAEEFERQCDDLGLSGLVRFMPTVDYECSIREILRADGLLLLQGGVFNNQIPGKVYEYLRAGKPILALTAKGSATEELLASVDHALIADMEDENDIYKALCRFSSVSVAEDFDYAQYSRRYRTRQLAKVLQEISG